MRRQLAKVRSRVRSLVPGLWAFTMSDKDRTATRRKGRRSGRERRSTRFLRLRLVAGLQLS